jgi:hypothetical protein
LSGIVIALAGAGAAYAHHSFAAEFDRDQNVEFTGTVTQVDWTNPHARFYVRGPDPDMDDDTPVDWNIELASANVLMRQGWQRNSLKVGDVVTVSASRARKDPHVVNARTVVDADGERLFGRGPNQPGGGPGGSGRGDN